jgi:cardiolipin synthase
MGQWLPAWLVLLVVGRDLLIVCGVIAIRRRHSVFQPRPLSIGKINTLTQILLAACAIAPIGGWIGGWIDWGLAVEVLIVAVALTTVLSGAGYAAQAVRSIGPERTS